MLSKFRVFWKLLRIGFHILSGCLRVALFFWLYDETRKNQIVEQWSKKLLLICGVTIRFPLGDKLPQESALLVANHVSWLDVFVINSLQCTHFICKDDVRSWPIIGWLVGKTGAVFLNRGSRQAVHKANEDVASILKSGEWPDVFPEGTTTNGEFVLPFQAALLQSVINVNLSVQPLAIRYFDLNGKINKAPVYDGDKTIWGTLQLLLDQRASYVDLHILPPINASNLDRRELSTLCRRVITDRLGIFEDFKSE